MALDEEDWATWNFLQWFVKEQIEEENLANYLMDKITLAGGENAKGDALYQLDKETSGEVRLAQDVTTANP
jgi:ferritin